MQKILIVFLLGCGKGPEPIPPITGAPLPIDGAAVVTPEVVVDAAPSEQSPPTGYYMLSSDLNDGCSNKKLSSSFEQPVLVLVKHDRGRTLVNVPIVVTTTGGAQARQDMALDQKMHFVKPSQTCPGVETVIDSEVKTATHDTLRIVRTETFGDGSKCPQPPLESKCTRETVLTYTLKKSLCEGPCNPMNVRLLTDGGMDLECKCP